MAWSLLTAPNRVLAIRRRENDQWQLPAASSNLAKPSREALQREVLEGTGMRVRVERLTGVYKNMTLGVVTLVFRCTPISGTPQATDEYCEVRWLNLADAVADATHLRHPRTRRRIPAYRSSQIP